jgi:hypothetical protein
MSFGLNEFFGGSRLAARQSSHAQYPIVKRSDAKDTLRNYTRMVSLFGSLKTLAVFGNAFCGRSSRRKAHLKGGEAEEWL